MKKLVAIAAVCLVLPLIACSTQQKKFTAGDITKIELIEEYPPFETFEVSEEDQKAIIEFLNRKETFSKIDPMDDGLPEGDPTIMKIYGKETTVINLLYPNLVLDDTWYDIGLENDLRNITEKYTVE